MAHVHHHGHAHAHGHTHAPASLEGGAGLNNASVALKVVHGAASHWLALLADAGHNASDVFAPLLAWATVWVARRTPP